MLLHFASITTDLSPLMVVMITISAELGDLKRATDLGIDRSVAPHISLPISPCTSTTRFTTVKLSFREPSYQHPIACYEGPIPNQASRDHPPYAGCVGGVGSLSQPNPTALLATPFPR